MVNNLLKAFPTEEIFIRIDTDFIISQQQIIVSI